MLIGYMRISKADGSQIFDLQQDALLKAGVKDFNIYSDKASGSKDDRPGLNNCLRALREDDILYVWTLDRLGRNLRHLIKVVEGLNERGIGLRVLSGQGASIDTTTATGKLMFSMFGAFAEFERAMIRERTIAGLNAARARGRNGGRKYKLTPSQLKMAAAAMKNRDIKVVDLCRELNISVYTIYKYISPKGEYREPAKALLSQNKR